MDKTSCHSTECSANENATCYGHGHLHMDDKPTLSKSDATLSPRSSRPEATASGCNLRLLRATISSHEVRGEHFYFYRHNLTSQPESTTSRIQNPLPAPPEQRAAGGVDGATTVAGILIASRLTPFIVDPKTGCIDCDLLAATLGFLVGYEAALRLVELLGTDHAVEHFTDYKTDSEYETDSESSTEEEREEERLVLPKCAGARFSKVRPKRKPKIVPKSNVKMTFIQHQHEDTKKFSRRAQSWQPAQQQHISYGIADRPRQPVSNKRRGQRHSGAPPEFRKQSYGYSSRPSKNWSEFHAGRPLHDYDFPQRQAINGNWRNTNLSVSVTKRTTSQDHQTKSFEETVPEVQSLPYEDDTDASHSSTASTSSTQSRSLSTEGSSDSFGDSGFCSSGCSESYSQEENEIIPENAAGFDRDALISTTPSSDKSRLGPPPGFESASRDRLKCTEEACLSPSGFCPRTGPPPGFNRIVPLGPPPGFEKWESLKEVLLQEKAVSPTIESRIAEHPPAQSVSLSPRPPRASNEVNANYAPRMEPSWWSTCHTTGFDLRLLFEGDHEFLAWISGPGDHVAKSNHVLPLSPTASLTNSTIMYVEPIRQPPWPQNATPRVAPAPVPTPPQSKRMPKGPKTNFKDTNTIGGLFRETVHKLNAATSVQN